MAGKAKGLPAAVLFDMDGLLLDTERLHLQCFADSCRKHGLIPDMEAIHASIGTTWQKTREILEGAYGETFRWDSVRAEWWNLYHKRIAEHPVPVKTGAQKLLSLLSELNIPCIVVTSSSHADAKMHLNSSNLINYFVDVVGGDQVNMGKPDPEPYLEGLRRLNTEASQSWALEDSENGVSSALAAGLQVFQIPDLVQPGKRALEANYTLCTSLHDVLALVQRLNAGRP